MCLFEKVLHSPHHVYSAISCRKKQFLTVNSGRGDIIEKINKTSHIADSDYIVRMLYEDIYWLASSVPANHLQDGGACVEVPARCSPSLFG